MGVQTGLEQALNFVAPDADTWNAGWAEFFQQLGEQDATVSEALNAALEVANSGPLNRNHLRSCRGKFFHYANQSSRPVEQEESSSGG